MAASIHDLRRLRPVPDPIPWYLRVGYNDHKMLEDRLSAGDTRLNRAVIDAAYLERHAALRKELQRRRAELVLDPRIAELATPAGQRDTLKSLPWASLARETESARYDGVRITAIARLIANTTVARGFSAVLAPTHALSATSDRWIDVDIALTRFLRRELDAVGGEGIKLYYPLIIPYAWLASHERMIALAGTLSTTPSDAVWLRVSNFKNDKSAAAVRHYIEGARALLSSDRPLIADHIGGFSGLAILAFGVAGGLAHGIGVREGFSVTNWQKTNVEPFSPSTRAYVGDADLYVEPRIVAPVLEDPVIRARMGCKNKRCCPRGIDDMFGNAKNHVINTRLEQLAAIASGAPSHRAAAFIRHALIPAGATLIKLDHALNEHRELQRRVQKKRRFVDNLKSTLESLNVEAGSNVRRSPIPRRASFLPPTPAPRPSPRPTL